MAAVVGKIALEYRCRPSEMMELFDCTPMERLEFDKQIMVITAKEMNSEKDGDGDYETAQDWANKKYGKVDMHG